MAVSADTAAARQFWSGHPGEQAWCDERYGAQPSRPRQWLLDGLAMAGQVRTVRTVLEVGCHCGPMLAMLQAEGLEATGVDVNRSWVGLAQGRGLDARLGAVPECLAAFPDASFDAVVSSYCLAYVSPADLPATLAECMRVAAVGLVLVEPSAGPGVTQARATDGSYLEWRHEYLDALEVAWRTHPSLPSFTMERLRRDDPDSDVNALIVVRLHGRS